MISIRSAQTAGTILTAHIALAVLAPDTRAQWLQWGGPNRDFKVEALGLADEWPSDGPRRLWHRPLGSGYSAIVVDEGVLYTMYRKGTDEFTVALNAQTGGTIWEHKNPSPRKPNDDDGTRPGPCSTPLVSQGRLYTIGTDTVIHCFAKKKGTVLWRRDLIKKLGARTFHWGYAASPIAYKDLIITPVDRDRPKGQEDALADDDAQRYVTETTGNLRGITLMAFDQVSGEIVWKSQDFVTRHSSPILITLEGEDQIVLLLSKGIMGVRPDSGALLWHHTFAEGYYRDMTPLWVDGNVLLVASGERTRAVRLSRKDGNTVTEEVWSNGKLRFPQNNPIHVGDYIYGSSGSPWNRANIVCADIRTGDRRWIARGFALATCVYADKKFIILDENGKLGLAAITPEGMTLRSTCQVTELQSWTVPTLVGTTLYVRDRKHIMALDLGKLDTNRES